jgi:hypothetical protein
MRSQPIRRLPAALAAPIVAFALLLTAAPAQATTFCVPTFDPPRCPNDGLNVAQANLESAMQSDASDGEADTVVVAPGTYTDPDAFSTAGTDALTIEGAGAGGAADATATRLTTSSTANIYVVNLAASLSRDVVMRDLTVVVPPSLPDNAGAAMQVGGDTLERVDVEIANPYSDAIPSWPEGGAYEEGTIYAVGNGVVRTAIGTGNVAYPGQVSVDDATLVEPLYGIRGQHPELPASVERTTIERPSQVAILASEGGQVTATNSVVLVDGAVTALNAAANTAADAEVDADHLTVVQEGPALGTAAGSSASSTGKSTMLVENSILRGFGFPYSRVSTGGGDADLTIRYTNSELSEGGPSSGPGTLDVTAGNIDADPMFAGAAPYGSPTDLALQPGSPSVDAGDPATGGAATDFLGASRPQDGDADGTAIRDQGAFELQPSPEPTPEPTPGPSPEPSSGPGPAVGPGATSAAATPADTAVALRILGKRVRIGRRGIGRLRLRCPAAEQSPSCGGMLVLRTRARLRLGKGKRRHLVLARARFEIAAGKSKAIRLRVRGRKLRLLGRRGRVRRLLAIARVSDGAGNRGTARRRLRALTGRS